MKKIILILFMMIAFSTITGSDDNYRVVKLDIKATAQMRVWHPTLNIIVNGVEAYLHANNQDSKDRYYVSTRFPREADIEVEIWIAKYKAHRKINLLINNKLYVIEFFGIDNGKEHKWLKNTANLTKKQRKFFAMMNDAVKNGKRKYILYANEIRHLATEIDEIISEMD